MTKRETMTTATDPRPTECRHCGGEGNAFDEDAHCPACEGTGWDNGLSIPRGPARRPASVRYKALGFALWRLGGATRCWGRSWGFRAWLQASTRTDGPHGLSLPKAQEPATLYLYQEDREEPVWHRHFASGDALLDWLEADPGIGH